MQKKNSDRLLSSKLFKINLRYLDFYIYLYLVTKKISVKSNFRAIASLLAIACFNLTTI
ncbi:MAG: hypothetical protein F6K54_12450 [Okeania sp. SIO3B5]|uniref:hypothetical protein n=1 Tax=Okeania sp. SIO3B5 TaxID=2607811 RepID=UPI001400BB7B|nr:hypothetical protein [Okeania sp. SIO3B5]NEO53819.1 hypothetical protein [Okeania sp. SIO3B5]